MRRGLSWCLETPFLVLITSTALAWLLLGYGGGSLVTVPVLCTGRLLGIVPGDAELAYVLWWVSPAQLSAGWAVMLVAMMAPVVAGPIAHVRQRSFRSDRILRSAAFLTGYFSAWMLAGAPFIALALGIRLSTADSAAAFLTMLGLAVLWQITTWKQFALNRCHARPALPAWGARGIAASLQYGVSHGWWCIVSCAPMMITALVAPPINLLWMMLLSMWIWAERWERPVAPAFRLRIPLRALRAARFKIAASLGRRTF